MFFFWQGSGAGSAHSHVLLRLKIINPERSGRDAPCSARPADCHGPAARQRGQALPTGQMPPSCPGNPTLGWFGPVWGRASLPLPGLSPRHSKEGMKPEISLRATARNHFPPFWGHTGCQHARCGCCQLWVWAPYSPYVRREALLLAFPFGCHPSESYPWHLQLKLQLPELPCLQGHSQGQRKPCTNRCSEEKNEIKTIKTRAIKF